MVTGQEQQHPLNSSRVLETNCCASLFDTSSWNFWTLYLLGTFSSAWGALLGFFAQAPLFPHLWLWLSRKDHTESYK